MKSIHWGYSVWHFTTLYFSHVAEWPDTCLVWIEITEQGDVLAAVLYGHLEKLKKLL